MGIIKAVVRRLAPSAALTLALLTTFAAPRVARAQPLKTWGNDPTAPDPQEPARTGAPPGPPGSPPPPPPPPVDFPRAPGDPGGDDARPADPAGIVRGPGRVGLRYVVEGVEIRGNTSTLARVIERFVPFNAGDTLDVDDKELLLTRFRLLGAGFFRDVQLSLRRGTKR